MKRLLIATVFSLSSPLALAANPVICKMDQLKREVEVIYPKSESQGPCEVHYRKPSEEAQNQILWTAKNTPSFCEEKAAGFVEKLKGLGWNCEKGQ